VSISKYIEEFNASIEKTIQKRVKKAEENPYPTEEITQLREQDPESAIAKMFDENGEVLAPLFNNELMLAAVEEDKDLYRRLRRGHNAKKGLKNNEYLESLDAEEYLNNNYFKLVSKVSEINSLGGKLDIEEILTSSEDDFLDAAYSGLDLDMSYVSDATIQAALLEKYNAPAEEETVEDQEETSPINAEDEEVEEEESFELAEPNQVESEIVDIDVEPSDGLAIPEETPTPLAPINDEQEEAVESTENATILETMQDMASDVVNQQQEETPLETVSTINQQQDENPLETVSTINQQQDENPLETVSTINQQQEENPLETVSTINKFETFEEFNNLNTTNENVNNNFLEDGDVINQIDQSVSNLETTSSIENISDSINSNENVVNNSINDTSIQSDIINASSDVPNVTSESTENITNVSNLSQINDSSGDSFTSLNSTVSGTQEDETINIENSMSEIETDLSTSSNFTSFDNSSIVKPEPITKDDITTVSKDISSGIASSLSIPAEQETVSQEEPSRKEIRKEERRERKEAKQAEREERKNISINDYSSLEKRLKNIEILLSGPLEVKIKN